MVYTSIKIDNTVAALDIPSIITVKIIAMYNNQCQQGHCVTAPTAHTSCCGNHNLEGCNTTA